MASTKATRARSAAPLAVDQPVADASAMPFDAIDAAIATQKRPRASVAAAFVVAGVALIIVSGWGVRSANVGVRSLLALVGLVVLWRGLQSAGTIRWGARFRLGLLAAFGWLGLVSFCAVFAGWLPIEHWKKADIANRTMKPGLRWPEPLGRTATGYSELSHVIYGARVSLTVGLVAVIVGMALGVLAGMLAAWYGKALDAGISVMTNTILAFPSLVFLMSVIAVWGSGVTTLALGLAVLFVPTYTRLMRAQALAIRQREFVTAARAMGASGRRLMWREVFPNAVIPVAAYSFLVVGAVIVAEGSLSYLGIGIPPPQPSWGGMIADGQTKLKTFPHLVFVPAVMLFLTVVSFNRIGDWAREVSGGDRNNR